MLLTALSIAISLGVGGCGDEEGTSGSSASQEAAPDDALDPTAVASSVEEFLEGDEYAATLAPSVDCGEEAAPDRLRCSISGDQNLRGSVIATQSEGISYTGQIEGPDGPVSLGGSTSEGDVSDSAGVEASLAEALADQPGSPVVECPQPVEGEPLECSVSGEVSGTLTVTPAGGFEWEGQLETPEGPRAISGNEVP